MIESLLRLSPSSPSAWRTLPTDPKALYDGDI